MFPEFPLFDFQGEPRGAQAGGGGAGPLRGHRAGRDPPPPSGARAGGPRAICQLRYAFEMRYLICRNTS